MAYGVTRVYSAGAASGATTSSGFDLGERDWNAIYLEVPTMISGADLYLQGSSDNTTFRRIQAVGPSTVSYSVSIASAITLTSAIDLEDGVQALYLRVPSLATGTSILVQGSLDNVTFQRVQIAGGASGSTAVDFAIATFTVNSPRLVPIPANLRYIKIELATGVTDATSTWKLLGTKNQTQYDYVIPSNVTNKMVPIPTNFRYLKVELSSYQTNTSLNFNVICSD